MLSLTWTASLLPTILNVILVRENKATEFGQNLTPFYKALFIILLFWLVYDFGKQWNLTRRKSVKNKQSSNFVIELFFMPIKWKLILNRSRFDTHAITKYLKQVEKITNLMSPP
jgi:hypothetical protein